MAWALEHGHSLAAKGLARSLADYATPDLAAVAHAMGGSGLRIDSPAGLDQLPAALAEADGTLLVDVHVNPAFVSPASAEIARRMRGATLGVSGARPRSSS